METTFFKSATICIMMMCISLCFADGNDTIPQTPENPFGNKIEIPLKGIKHNRSLNEPVEAYYYNNEYLIEIEFVENIGVVNVVVRNTNNIAVYNVQHDTATEDGCSILLPAQTECYSIDITGSNYYAYGSICL